MSYTRRPHAAIDLTEKRSRGQTQHSRVLTTTLAQSGGRCSTEEDVFFSSGPVHYELSSSKDQRAARRTYALSTRRTSRSRAVQRFEGVVPVYDDARRWSVDALPLDPRALRLAGPVGSAGASHRGVRKKGSRAKSSSVHLVAGSKRSVRRYRRPSETASAESANTPTLTSAGESSSPQPAPRNPRQTIDERSRRGYSVRRRARPQRRDECSWVRVRGV